MEYSWEAEPCANGQRVFAYLCWKHKHKKTAKFASELIENQKPLDPEYSKTVDENFWELI